MDLPDKKISSRSLQAGGAMALLLRNIDTDTIYLIGQWRSNKIMCYLRIAVCLLIQGHTTTMVAAGNYTLIPVVPTLTNVS